MKVKTSEPLIHPKPITWLGNAGSYAPHVADFDNSFLGSLLC